MTSLDVCAAMIVISAASSCATIGASPNGGCAVAGIDEVARDPMAHAGERFCGEVFAVEYGRSAHFLRSSAEAPPSLDLALLVTTRTRRLLTALSVKPQLFYVEAHIDPQAPCFLPSGSDE
jgi:hypothetical protein